MSRSSSLLNENFKPPSQNLLGPQGLLEASRRWSDDADPDPESLLPFLKDVEKMDGKDDELQTNFGATRCSFFGLAT